MPEPTQPLDSKFLSKTVRSEQIRLLIKKNQTRNEKRQQAAALQKGQFVHLKLKNNRIFAFHDIHIKSKFNPKTAEDIIVTNVLIGTMRNLHTLCTLRILCVLCNFSLFLEIYKRYSDELISSTTALFMRKCCELTNFTFAQRECSK